jgi:hypothetical protein
LIGSHLFVIFKKRDWWPYSCYPMFSTGGQVRKTVEIFRVALVKKTGESYWWRPRFYEDGQDFCTYFNRIFTTEREGASKSDRLAGLMEKTRRLVFITEDPSAVVALRVIRRTAHLEGGSYKIEEVTVLNYPLDGSAE